MPETNPPNKKKLVLISAAAEFLGVSIDTVRRWDKRGIIHSERPFGKDRYFDIEELEKHKTAKPLSISEAASLLKVSTSTLRRLDKKGLITCQKNANGERLFRKEDLEKYKNSDYGLGKTSILGQIFTTTVNQEKEVVEELESKKKEKHSNYSESKSEEKPNNQQLSHSELTRKPSRRIPEFAASFVIFILLLGIGIRNISVSQTTSATLGATTITSPAPTAQPEPKIIVKVNYSDSKIPINIREKPTIESKIIGEAFDGDELEFVSEESGWHQIKLSNGSNGFILSTFIGSHLDKQNLQSSSPSSNLNSSPDNLEASPTTKTLDSGSVQIKTEGANN